MLKIIPLIIFPFSFFIIFLGVKNLTQNFSVKNDNTIEKAEIISEQELDKAIDLSVKKTSDELATDDELKKKKIDDSSDKTKKKNDLVLDKIDDTKIDKKIVETFNKTDEQINIKKKNDKILGKLNIQFGAFSKEKNALEYRENVLDILKKEFPDIRIEVKYQEINKLYKLLFKTDNKELAEKICNFSKEVKISCIVIKI